MPEVKLVFNWQSEFGKTKHYKPGSVADGTILTCLGLNRYPVETEMDRIGQVLSAHGYTLCVEGDPEGEE